MNDPNIYDEMPPSQERENSFVTPTDEMEEQSTESNKPIHFGQNPETFDEDIPQAVAPPKARKGVPLPKRISQLTYEKKLLEEQLQQAEYVRQVQLAELQRENQAYRAQLIQKEDSEIDNLESTIQSNEHVIMNEMRRAKEEQDIAAEMKWQRELNELQKASAQVQAHKAARQVQVEDAHDEYYTEAVAPRMPQPSVADVNPHFLEWTESTPWANQNDPNYSPELMGEADEIAVELNKKLRVARRADVIGTPEYFATINEIIEGRHGVGTPEMEYENNAHSQRQHYQSSPASHVGGVNRQGATMAEQYARQNQGQRPYSSGARLSPEQEMVARNLQIKGNDGRYLNPVEARNRYIKHLKAPVAPGGTQFRMIFDHGA